MTSKFVVGQRVMVRCAKPGPGEINGYFGFVEEVHPPGPYNTLAVPMYDVALTGRVGGRTNPSLLSGRKGSGHYDPYPLYENELEAAD
ncbi:MAG: hypothetical protein LLG14_04655 [Nocardiaceae bacterium]|nr:hypothetical protein [Nocardiaceae bacterium]